MQFGMPLPDALKNPPELLPGLALYLEAFWDLHTCRQIGMSLGPIPWTSVNIWATMNLTSEDSIKDLHYFVRKLDSEFLRWSQSNKESPK